MYRTILISATRIGYHCPRVLLLTEPSGMFLVSGPEDHFLGCVTAHIPAQFLQWCAGHHQTVCRELREGSQRSRSGTTGTPLELCLWHCAPPLPLRAPMGLRRKDVVRTSVGGELCVTSNKFNSLLEVFETELLSRIQDDSGQSHTQITRLSSVSCGLV